ncbi:putative Sequestosome-1 [Hypsibius exemplaris]|uniref:Sequestosome-1 n=1 Tax=Hypsibius exemplaris TaxID=2072580 RepID=A0A1W0WE65_HYPEX|nr:putative Sequestosome-1 [Hypsibius exemplaris]
MATQVKLYIEPDQEIRRFNLEANATFEVLRQRVEGLVGHANFRIQWQDSERDMIVLGSADELAAAKEVLTNNLLRLFVRPTKTAVAGGEKKVHRGVTCDGCGGVVAGSRFKCLLCPDYDLCEGCHGKGTHSEHDMLVIRAPRSSEWKKVFAQGYGTREGFPMGEQTGPCGGRRHCGPGAGGHHPHHHHAGMGPFPAFPGGHFGPAGLFAGAHGMVPPPFFGAGGERVNCGSGRRGPCGRRAAAAQQEQTVEMDMDMTRPVADIIADVAKKVKEAIHKSQQASGTATPQEQKQPEQPQTEEEKKAEQQEEADAVASVVNAVAEAVTVVSDVAENVEGDQQKPPAEKESQDEQNAKDQRIENALRALEEMGFPNEGLLMRRLLENYNGDLNRVLDSIK